VAPGVCRFAAQNVALLALGGYGRKDLFPYSDIDVLFAFADEKTEEQSKEAVRAIIQGMWDIGLRASPSSRTVKEAGRFDPDNLEFTLATLDRRFLAGQFPLYQQLHSHVSRPGAERVERRLRKSWARLPARGTPSSATRSFIWSPT
jgi:UTP:GlnB (protein PII) uridylyltransferase